MFRLILLIYGVGVCVCVRGWEWWGGGDAKKIFVKI